MILPPRWATLQPYLDEALDGDEATRAALMDRLRLQDADLAELLQQQLALLDQAQAAGFLQQSPAPGLLGEPLAGQRLGAWRLRSQLGEGGQGTVWLADRDDGRFQGQAAVKLLNLSLSASSAAERFKREGHILARLAHPHIARLFDAGITPSGTPYLVLEHVQGQSIEQHCRSRRLDVRQRVQLFITLLAAVDHAHRHLVVHRDIKPENVLVTETGELKLLDFGIAKLQDPDEELPAEVTRRVDNMLTAGYAAPEQVSGHSITTATDVYALGMLLYTLLAGQHPFLRKGRTYLETLRLTTEEEPPRMSMQVAEEGLPGVPLARLRRLLRGDLDNIVAQAVHLQPQARYAGAAAMAEDLQRHLQQRPVHARTPSWLYRLGRLVQRQRLPLAALGSGLVVAGVVGLQAWDQSQVARANELRAASIDALLQSVFEVISPDNASQRLFSARELLDNANLLLNGGPPLDAHTQRQARQRMARLYRDIGAYEPATALHQQLVASAEQDPATKPRTLALALWQLADTQVKGLRQADAGATLQRLLQLTAAAPALALDHELAGRTALLQAELALHGSQFGHAEALYRDVHQRFAQARVQDPELLLWAAQGHGQAARMNGQIEIAREQIQRALVLLQQRGPKATSERLHQQLQLGALESWAGRPQAAVGLLEGTHTELLARVGPDHPRTVSAVNELAWAHIRLGQFEPARAWLARLRGGSGPDNAWRTPFANLLEARIQLYSGQADDAVPQLRALLADSVQRETQPSVRTEAVRRILGEALLRAGQLPAALEVLESTQRTLQQLDGASHSRVATTRVLLGCALARQGQLERARSEWSRAAQDLDQSLGPAHPFSRVAAAYLTLAGGHTPSTRAALAQAIEDQLAWQHGAPELARWLRSAPATQPWSQLPVVL